MRSAQDLETIKGHEVNTQGKRDQLLMQKR